MSEFVDAIAYLTIRAERYHWGTRGVTAAKPVKVTQAKPQSVGKDHIVVKLRVRLPKAVFEPIEPEGVIDVPASVVIRHVLEAEALPTEEAS